MGAEATGGEGVSVFWGPRGNMWEPQGGERKEWRELQPGDLVVNGRKVWVIREVRLVPLPDWDERDREGYAQRDGYRRGRGLPGATEEEWPYRPLYLIVVPAAGGKRRHVKVRPYAGWGRTAYALHPHYPVCRECGEPWPCPELDIKRELDKSAAEMARLEGIMPGCCWCCGEPVTSRHKAIVFDGENLLLPGGPPAVFHLRQRSKGGRHLCRSAAISYEERWVPAGEGRRWRISCPGRCIRHVDGLECAEEPVCPGPEAWHGGDVMSHRFYRTGDGAVMPVMGTGADKCRRCLDAVEGGIFERRLRDA